MSVQAQENKNLNSNLQETEPTFHKTEMFKSTLSDEDDYNFLLESPLPYFLIAIAYSLFYIGVYFHNQCILILFVYGVLPLCDKFVSLDLINPSKEKQKKLKQKNTLFKIPLYFAVFMEVFTFIYGIKHMMEHNHDYFYLFTLLFVLATFQGVSFNYSHELNHKVDKLDNLIGCILLIKNFYLHWYVEHNYGHHRFVATPRDPASAVKGQTFYNFFPKSFIGSFTSSIQVENEIIKDEGRSQLTNRVYWSFVIYIIYVLGLFYFFSSIHAISIIGIGIIGAFYLEIVNYLEHYGLRREKLPNGEYENVSIHHSWNTPHRLTNYFLFKLQRHSDHHANALKPYQTLLI